MSRSRLILAALLIPALAGLGYWGYLTYLAPQPDASAPTPAAQNRTDAPDLVSAEGKLIPRREAALAFRLAGRVAEVLVAEGQPVRAGDPLIRLESADLQAAVAQAQAAVAQAEANVAVAQAQFDQLAAGARPEELAALEAQLKSANSSVGRAVAQRDDAARGATPDQIAAAEAQVAQATAQRKKAQDAYNGIVNAGLEGDPRERAWLDYQAAVHAEQAALAALDQLKAGASDQLIQGLNSGIGVAAFQRDAVRAQLELLQAGATAEQNRAAEAQVRQAAAAAAAARAAHAAALVQLGEAVLVAPFTGTVVSLNFEIGEVVVPGAPALVLADLSQWRLKTLDLSEADVVLVRPGQTASVTLDAVRDQTFRGVVAEIAAVAEINRGNTTYAVTIDLAPAQAPLRWGMTAFVDIDVSP